MPEHVHLAGNGSKTCSRIFRTLSGAMAGLVLARVADPVMAY